MGPIETATRKQLRGQATVSPVLYAAAVRLARTADETESARDITAAIKELRATVAELVAAAPPQTKSEGKTDEVSRQREARRAAAARQ